MPRAANTLLIGDGTNYESLFRLQAGYLGTNSIFDVRRTGASDVAHEVGYGASLYWYMTALGGMNWGTGAAWDTNLYRPAAGVLRTDGAFSSGAYGTSLPASPVDGQEAILVDSTTAPTYQWRFRYNASSTSTYKWEFIGGNPVQVSELTGNVTSAINTWYAFHGSGQFTVPRAGVYVVQVSAAVQQNTSAGRTYIAAGNCTTVTAAGTNSGMNLAAGAMGGLYASGNVTAAAADKIGGLIQTDTATATEARSNTIVAPVRVS